ncbi:hypothetical protein KCU87_g7439, partial [Aureobasidium melanogenum]
MGADLSTMSRTTIFKSCKKLSFFMLPSFIQTRIRGPTARQQAQHSTSFLDGMRGVAAFLVMVCHNTYNHYDIFYGYHSRGGDGQNWEPYKLPFIRIVYQGATMVAVFFVISGYALSYKPVKLMRNKDWQTLSKSLGSSIFRRAMRLFLPCIVSTFFVSVIIWAGLYNMGADYARKNGQYNTYHNVNEPKFDTLSKQMLYWLQETSTKLINPWSFVPKDFIPVIDGHLWTIPIEFRSSLILYVTQAGLAHLSTRARMSIIIGLIVWVHQMYRWEMILFYSGFLLAEIDHYRASRLPSSLPLLEAAATTRYDRLKTVFFMTVFIVGVYLGCQPQLDAGLTPGWITLWNMIPGKSREEVRLYWPSWGAIMLVWSTSCSRPLKKMFDNRVAQYLGYISYSMYLVHGLVLNTVGYGVINIANGAIGADHTANKAIGFGMGLTASILTTIWLADFFTRAVDEPLVKFAEMVEQKFRASID